MARSTSPTLDQIIESVNLKVDEQFQFPDFLFEADNIEKIENEKVKKNDEVSDEDMIKYLSNTYALDSKIFQGLERWKLEDLYGQSILHPKTCKMKK